MSDNSIQHIKLEEAQEQSDVLSNFDLPKLFFVIRKSLPWILLIFFSAGTAIYLFLRYTKPIYEGRSVIKLEYQSSTQMLGFDVGYFREGIDAINLAGEIELIRSRLIYKDVIDNANLRTSYFVAGEVLNDEKYGSTPFTVECTIKNQAFYNKPIFISILSPSSFELKYEYDGIEQLKTCRFYERVENDHFSLLATPQPSLEDENVEQYFFIVNSEESLYSYLAKNLQVSIENQAANTIRISFTDNNRSKAISIIEAINDNYLVKTIDNKNLVYEQSLSYLNRYFEIVKDTLAFYENQLENLTEGVDEVPLREDFYGVFAKIENFQEQRFQLDLELANYDRIQRLIELDSSLVYLSIVSGIVNNSRLSQAIDNMIALEEKAERIGGYYKSTTAARRLIDRELTLQEQELTELIKFSKENLANKRLQLEQQIKRLEESLITENEEVAGLKKLQRYYTFYDRIADNILSKRLEMEMAKASTVPDFRILSPPAAPNTPIYPVQPIVYGIGTFAAVLISVGFVFIRYTLQNKINNLKELQRVVNVPVLGMVPSIREAMDFSQLVVDKKPKSSISESIRTIRTNLEFLAPDSKKKIISVTSTISGEGKTFIAVNLGGIIAMASSKVVIVDLDLRKPKIHLAFNSDNNIGVSNLLINRGDLEKCIMSTSIPTLHYIPAGPIPPNPSELIMSEAFEQLLQKLKQQFDVIILDTPPVGLVTDGVIVMKKATLPLYVFRAGYSRLSFGASVNALSEIKEMKGVAAILNAADIAQGYGYDYYTSGYGYKGYGYGYGYGYSQSTYGQDSGYYEEEKEEKLSWWKKVLKRK